MYIAFDGIDGAGKTTLIEKVMSVYPAEDVRLFKLPRPTYIENSYVDEAEQIKDEMKIPAKLRVQDRSILTTMTYSMLEIKNNSKYDLASHLSSLEMMPDIIFYLDYPPHLAWARKSDMFTEEFITKVYNMYDRSIKYLEIVYPRNVKIIRIDAQKELDEKLTEVLDAIS